MAQECKDNYYNKNRDQSGQNKRGGKNFEVGEIKREIKNMRT